MALALIVQGALGLEPWAALAFAVAVMGGYTALGGYRVATETDLVQALIIVAGMALGPRAGLWRGGVAEAADATGFFDLGPWGLPFLIAVMVFLPFSAVLAVDNWQRIATRRNRGHSAAGLSGGGGDLRAGLCPSGPCRAAERGGGRHGSGRCAGGAAGG